MLEESVWQMSRMGRCLVKREEENIGQVRFVPGLRANGGWLKVFV